MTAVIIPFVRPKKAGALVTRKTRSRSEVAAGLTSAASGDVAGYRAPNREGAEWLPEREPAGRRWIRARMPTLTAEQTTRALGLLDLYSTESGFYVETFLTVHGQGEMDRLLNEGGVPAGDRSPGRIRHTWEVVFLTVGSVTAALVGDKESASTGSWGSPARTGAELRWVQALVERDQGKASKAWPVLRASSRFSLGGHQDR